MHKETLKNMTRARFPFSLNKSLIKNKTDCISCVKTSHQEIQSAFILYRDFYTY